MTPGDGGSGDSSGPPPGNPKCPEGDCAKKFAGKGDPGDGKPKNEPGDGSGDGNRNCEVGDGSAASGSGGGLWGEGSGGP